MAYLVGPRVTAGAPGQVDSTALNPVMTRAFDEDGNEYIYLQGVASTAIGSWVTFDEAGVTALLAANAKGFVAVATAATVASTYGWYLIYGTGQALLAANCADNATIGREGADGVAGDGRAAGDEIVGAMSRGATAGAQALAAVQLSYPIVNDFTGA
jgi:hypothetical protein